MKSVNKAIVFFVLLLINPLIFQASQESYKIDSFNKKADLFYRNAIYDSAIFYYRKSSLCSVDKKDFIESILKITNIFRIERSFDSAQIYINKLGVFSEEFKKNNPTLNYEYLHQAASIIISSKQLPSVMKLLHGGLSKRYNSMS